MRILYLLIGLMVTYSVAAQREVIMSGDTLKVKYDLGDLQVQYAPESNANLLSLNGFTPTLEANKPQLLHRGETFAIPQGYKIENVKTQILTCDTLDIKIAPSVFGNLIPNENTTLTYGEIEPYDGIWPQSIISQGKTQMYKGCSIGRFNIFPVAYDYLREKVYYTRTFIVNVILTPEIRRSVQSRESVQDIDLRHILSLPETAPTISIENAGDIAPAGIVLPPPTTPDYYYSPNYLIITPDFLANEAKRFAEWKSLLGYTVTIETVEDCAQQDADYFKDLIQERYYGDEPFDYVLLFGDGNIIKPHLGKHQFVQNGEVMQYYTDYYMSCLEYDDDDLPDVYIGRFPVSTIAEANALVTKIINYEKNPPSDDRFYENTILYSEYDKEEVMDASYFIEACYQIYTGLKDHTYFDKQYVPHDFYHALPKANPQYYYGYRQMPQYLRNYNWLSSPDSMIEEWNRGVYLLGVHGHGEVFGWINNGVRRSHLNQLKPTSNIPVLFSFNCYSGAFYHPNHRADEESICVQLLKQTNGGVASYIGANGYTWSPYNGYYFSGLYDAMYHGCIPVFQLGSNSAYTPTAYGLSYQLGKIMEIGRQRMSDAFEDISYNHDYYEAAKECFHIIGDPSLNVYHGKPLSLKPQFSKTTDGYVLNDPRRLIIRGKSSYTSYYYPRYYKMPLTKLMSLAECSDLCLVEDVPFQAYIPEIITKEQLKQLTNSASLEKIRITDNRANVEVNSFRTDITTVVYDIYGNVIDSAKINNNIGIVSLSSGLNLVTIEADGQILDSKRVMIIK